MADRQVSGASQHTGWQRCRTLVANRPFNLRPAAPKT